MPEIVICYAREDQAKAMRLYSDLRRAGLVPWIDTEDLLPGTHWSSEIKRVIRASRNVVLLLSASSMTKRGFVHQEIRAALEVVREMPENEVFLIPTRLEPCEVTHEGLGQLHWVDLFPDWNSGLEKLVAALRAHRHRKEDAAGSAEADAAAISGLSAEELKIAEHVLLDSENGLGLRDYTVEDLSRRTSLDLDEVKMAVAELVSRGYLKRIPILGTSTPPVTPTAALFWDLDLHVQGWSARADARAMAQALIDTSKSGKGRLKTRAFAEEEEWPLRRLNPALRYLVSSSIVNASRSAVPGLVTPLILETELTRAFLRGVYEPDTRRRGGT